MESSAGSNSDSMIPDVDRKTSTSAQPDDDVVLSVHNLTTVFRTDRETIYAVDGIDFDVRRGETVGIVGESGSGKSVTARSIMGLIDAPGEILPASSIRFNNDELTDYSDDEYRAIRGDGIGMVFQDPQQSLNPVYTIGNQIREALAVNQNIRGEEARRQAIELLEAVAIPDPARRLSEYPHEFSGGMRQRAVIAMMLACDPEFLICDEPTTALDVTIQAQILDLLSEIQQKRDLSILFITHDMGVIAQIADRVNVVYAGEIVEQAPVERLFQSPQHPYTRGLLDAIPGRRSGDDGLRTIEGDVPTPNAPASNCRFAPRCPKAFDECEAVPPQHVSVDDNSTHTAACLLYPAEMEESPRVAKHRRRAETETETETETEADANTGEYHE